MNWLNGRISKILALLAVVALPIQQSLAATCCCRKGHDAVQTSSTSSTGGCCSTPKASCCDSVSDSERSCCQSGKSHSGAKPCRCPAGCCGKIKPDTAVPATSEISSADELVVAATEIIEFLTADTNSAVTPSDSLLSISPSGAQLCVLLCRFTL